MNNKNKIAKSIIYLIALLGVLPAIIYVTSNLMGSSDLININEVIHSVSAPVVFTLLFICGVWLCLFLDDAKKLILLIPVLCMAVFPILSVNKSSHIPSGAVMAFNLATGCPKGWQLFTPSTGRVIVGAGSVEDNRDMNDKLLTSRKLFENGGIETQNQVPRHSHSFTYQEGSTKTIWGNRGDTGRKKRLLANFKKTINTKSAGKTVADNNMPPFIALYYCQKI